MEIAIAQKEIRRAYLRGGPGAIVSGLVWLVAGLATSASGLKVGFACLFFGGMLIFPIATLIVRKVFGRKAISSGNPGGLTVIETLVPMIGGFLAAWLLMPYRPELVFPMSAIAVGSHYFGFRTAYGDWTNWVLGGIICLAGIGTIFFKIPDGMSVPYFVAAFEFVFGCWFSWESTRREKIDGHEGS